MSSLAKLQRPAVADRLAREEIVWLTTVASDGQPQSSPVWFHWDGSTFLLMSRPRAGKIANIGHNSRVSLHLDADAIGSNIVTLEGFAHFVDDLDPGRFAAYVTKYAAGIDRLGTDPQRFVDDFSTAIEVVPARVRLFVSE
jgi:PPOX class probable F420-dependent enzyme